MVNFIDVKEKFKEHGCELLMTEDEFNTKTRSTTEKYEYTASCGHKHNVWFHVFKNRQTGVICPKCVILKDAINQKEKYKLNPILNIDLEYKQIDYLITLIGDIFDVKINGEGCISKCCIKPKNITEDLWLMIHMNSTEKPIRGYGFHGSPKYKDCLVMCICDSDKKMWGLNGNTIITKKISIGLKKSIYNEFEITKKNIHEKMTHYYNTFPKYDFETIDTPISSEQQLEREYRIYRETMINCLSFIRNERQLVYDFIVNNFKVQEKVGSKIKNKKGYNFTLNKHNGKKKSISYQSGDNDFYWLNLNNKKDFYIIPEHELLSRNIINTDKTASIYLNPNSTKKCNNSWAKEYLFDYTKVDEEKLKKMFSI